MSESEEMADKINACSCGAVEQVGEWEAVAESLRARLAAVEADGSALRARVSQAENHASIAKAREKAKDERISELTRLLGLAHDNGLYLENHKNCSADDCGYANALSTPSPSQPVKVAEEKHCGKYYPDPCECPPAEKLTGTGDCEHDANLPPEEPCHICRQPHIFGIACPPAPQPDRDGGSK